MRVPQFREWRLKDLKNAPHNPPHRSAPENVRDLAESIAKIGLMYPIIVDDTKTIIDGHRRAAACKVLGMETVPCVVQPAGEADAIYAGVNATPRKMGGNDALGVWLARPTAVTKLQASRFANMEAALGREMVQQLYDEGKSVKLFNLARRIGKYLDDDSTDLTRYAVKWMLTHPVSGLVAQLMARGENPKILRAAILKNKPLVLQAQLG